jgi:hypothetical protein
MKASRSRIFTLICILAMLVGLAAAAWAKGAASGRGVDRDGVAGWLSRSIGWDSRG